MKRFLFTILTIFLTPLLIYAQVDKDKWLIDKFKSADTVMLVSHQLTAGVTIVSDRTGKKIPLPKLLVKGRLNQKIITETKVISSSTVDKLLHILTRPDTLVTTGMCFIPRQAILLITNGKTSYIDICFHCHSYDTSKDLANIHNFDEQRWTELESFFRTQGLTYKLDEPPY